MKKIFKNLAASVLLMTSTTLAAQAQSVCTLTSPTTGLKAEMTLNDGKPRLIITDAAGQVVSRVRLGLNTSIGGFDSELTLVKATEPVTITENYHNIHGKCSEASNTANMAEVTLANPEDRQMTVELRAYEDGVTFRYKLDGEEDQSITFYNESTYYTIPASAHRWLQQFNTSYEADFPLQQTGGKQGTWAYPALFENDGTFTLITEANIGRSYSSTHLDNNSNANQYKLSYPFDYEGYGKGATNPSWKGAWTSPWRVLIIGSLATIVESTLVEDVSEPCKISNTGFIQPGRAAWVYWAYNHGTKDFQICKKYVDLAVEMGWEYVLFDWEWEQMGNGGTVEDAVRYALDNGVKPMLWYHSNDSKMQNHDERIKEMAWLKGLGVKGIKVDFFESDKQHTMQYFADILEDAAQYEILINFHGCTIPRGWSRTYPHLMSQEAVFGAEQYNNGGTMTTEGARINCLLTYTRNVVGPMDYTPVAYTDSQHPHTTSFAHETALSVAFESGIQHWADRPEGFQALPLMAKQHMMQVPVAWDETRFLQGYPCKSFIVARRKGECWYVAVLNGLSQATTFDIPLSFLAGGNYTASIIADGKEARKFSFQTQTVTKDSHIKAECLALGGAVITIQKTSDTAEAQFYELQQTIDKLVESASTSTGENSGFYRKEAVSELSESLNQSRVTAASGNPEDIYAAWQQLLAAYSNFQEYGQVEGGHITLNANLLDITKDYLIEPRNFSRDDPSTEPNTRFGLLAEPWIVTENIINQDNGTHGGFDSFEGGRAISVEKWNGGEPAMVNDKIYQTTSQPLPAGNYHLHISVTARAGLTNQTCLLRVARGNQLPGKGENTQDVLANFDMGTTEYSGEYDVCSFSLAEPTELTLGWVLNLPQNEGGHAFRVTAIRIIDENGTDVSASYIANYQNIQRRDRSYIRFGHPTNWQVDDFSIPNGNDGIKQGIDRYPGYDCLMLGVWDDADRSQGNLANTRIYREVTLSPGRYIFCGSFETTYNIQNSYMFVATQPLTANQTKEQSLAYFALPGTPADNDFYGITFVLEEETTLYLGWNADLTTASEQEFRVKALRLFRDPSYIPTGIKNQTTPPREGKSSAVYDLNGRHSTVLQKGIYIFNGKKAIIR